MEIHFPAIWLKAIKRNDHPYLEAIHILATCPWENTPYSEIGEQLQMTRERVKNAVTFLVRRGHINRIEKKGGCPTLIRLESAAEVVAKTYKHNPLIAPSFSKNSAPQGAHPQCPTTLTPVPHNTDPPRKRHFANARLTREEMLATCQYKRKKYTY